MRIERKPWRGSKFWLFQIRGHAGLAAERSVHVGEHLGDLLEGKLALDTDIHESLENITAMHKRRAAIAEDPIAEMRRDQEITKRNRVAFVNKFGVTTVEILEDLIDVIPGSLQNPKSLV